MINKSHHFYTIPVAMRLVKCIARQLSQNLFYVHFFININKIIMNRPALSYYNPQLTSPTGHFMLKRTKAKTDMLCKW